MATTVRLKGEGGSIFTFDLPLHPNVSKQLARGELRPADEKSAFLLEPPEPGDVEEEPQEGDPPTEDDLDLTSGSVDEVLARVADGQDAEATLASELSKDRPRTTLVEALGEIVSGPEPEES